MAGTNYVLSLAVKDQPEPEVGMGATILMFSDRYAGTITEVLNVHGKTIIAVQEDKATRTDTNGMSESQSYDYAPDPNGPVSYFRREATGRWRPVVQDPNTERWRQMDGPGLMLGRRDSYHDFSF